MSAPIDDFKPGLYEHYKGGRYIALYRARHHSTGRLFVVYVSCSHNTINIREWSTAGEDSWCDMVQGLSDAESLPVPRFRYLGPAL